MAEFVMKKLVRQAGREAGFDISSAALSDEETGNPVYPMARQELAMHGIGCAGHKARRITADDYAGHDLIVGMEASHLQQMRTLFGGDPDGKLRLLLDGKDIADPWYTRDFRTAWNDILAGCTALLQTFPPDDGPAC